MEPSTTDEILALKHNRRVLALARDFADVLHESRLLAEQSREAMDRFEWPEGIGSTLHAEADCRAGAIGNTARHALERLGLKIGRSTNGAFDLMLALQAALEKTDE